MKDITRSGRFKLLRLIVIAPSLGLPCGGGPGLLVPQLDGVGQSFACGVEEPDVGSVGLSLTEVEAAPVERNDQRVQDWISRRVMRVVTQAQDRIASNSQSRKRRVAESYDH